ncbi:MAG: hypothetical protein WA705_16480 [Candidatus Ozemobacteraceae bacterium]
MRPFSVVMALFLFFSFPACSWSFQNANDVASDTDGIVSDIGSRIETTDIENGQTYLDMSYFYKSYKGSSADYKAFPILLRFDGGKGLEWRIATDFLTYQKPVFGFADTDIGFKWNFKKNNPSLALISMVTLDSGKREFSDNAVEPEVQLAGNYKLTTNWSMSAFVREKSLVDAASRDRFNQPKYGVNVNFQASKKSSAFLGFSEFSPNAHPNGQDVRRINGGVSLDISKCESFYISLEKALSEGDIQLSGTFGYSCKL